MNSERPRIIIQKFIRYGVFLLLLPISSAIATEKETNTPSQRTLDSKISKLILEQWLTLGQREDSRSNVLIKGLPSGYKAPDKCAGSLIALPMKQLRPGDNSIEITCMLISSWSLMLNADIEVWRDVVVLRDHIARGESLTSSSLVLQKRNIADLQRGYFSSIEEVLGKISKRSLRSGAALNPTMIKLPILVERGQSITLRAESVGFSVDMKGEALKKGRLGDKIKVKNSSSDKVLYGTIMSADLVLVD